MEHGWLATTGYLVGSQTFETLKIADFFLRRLSQALLLEVGKGTSCPMSVSWKELWRCR